MVALNDKDLQMSDSYRVEVDSVGESGWEDVIQSFEDANVFQSWSWGKVRWGEKNLSHVLLKRGGITRAAAQAWIVRVPFIGKGIAYVKWGPMWKPGTDVPYADTYRHMLRALKDEYCSRRGLLLRVMPSLTVLQDDDAHSVLEDEGFIQSNNGTHYRTLVMDLSLPIDELRNGLKRQWRQCLNKAEQGGLSVTCGTGDELFDVFISIYREMQSRKGFVEFLDVNQMRTVNRTLPDPIKMTIYVCESAGSPMSACVISRIGNTALGLLAATGEGGLKVHSSHMLQWRIIESLKKSGCRWYDLGGIDPDNYAGTYMFKLGLSGKSGMDAMFRDFECSGGASSYLAVRTGDHIRLAYRRMKEWSARLRHLSRTFHLQ